MARRSKKVVWIIVLCVVLLTILGASVVWWMNRDTATKVQLDKVSKRTITQTVSAIGKIQPETEVKVSSEASGEVIFLGAKDGGVVRKGQVLARIKPDLIQTQLDQFRASVKASSVAIEIAKVENDRAESELKRTSDLFAKSYASKQELDNAKAAYERAQGQFQSALTDKIRAEAALKQIEVSVSRTTIYSPIDGTVTKLDIEQGEKVVGTAQMQGTEMMRVSDLSIMNAIVDVDENDVVKVKVGDTTRIKIDAFPEHTFNGYVYEISHSPKQKGLGTQDEVINFEVKVRLLDKEIALRPGMSCSVDIETDTHNDVLAVPLQAVTIRSEAKDKSSEQNSGLQAEKIEKSKKRDERPPQVVFTYDAGRVHQVRVETGISDNGFIEVTSGLNEGQSVVSGSFNTVSKVLNDSMRVQIDSVSRKKK